MRQLSLLELRERVEDFLPCRLVGTQWRDGIGFHLLERGILKRVLRLTWCQEVPVTRHDDCSSHGILLGARYLASYFLSNPLEVRCFQPKVMYAPKTAKFVAILGDCLDHTPGNDYFPFWYDFRR